MSWRLLLAGWCVGAIVACASSARQTAAPPAMAPTNVGANDPHAQIEKLSQQIDQQRQHMALPQTAHPMTAMTAPMSPMSTQDNTCHPAPTDTCKDTCTLADSICDSANKICDLAKDLPGDAWAEGKCSDAKQTCSDAHGKCCGCQ